MCGFSNYFSVLEHYSVGFSYCDPFPILQATATDREKKTIEKMINQWLHHPRKLVSFKRKLLLP